MKTFDELWNAVAEWAEAQAARIAAEGRALTFDELAQASKVGVKAPEQIRVLEVEAVPFPSDPTILAFGDHVGLIPENTGALTLGYGIYICRDQLARKDIWPHEFRHVAQYECFGSVRAFLYFYLKELIHFQYGAGPLEIDANHAESTALDA